MILELWENIVNDLNDKNECGFCWKFIGALTQKRFNLTRRSEDCCVHVALFRNLATDFGSNFVYRNGFLNDETRFENYEVMFLIQSKEGLNNYNEIEGHEVDQSRYETIFKPLRECIESNIIAGICTDYEVTQYSGRYIYDYQDEMYYGLAIRISQSFKIDR